MKLSNIFNGIDIPRVLAAYDNQPASEAGIKKGDVIRYALDSLKITADQAVMVGDRKHDVIGAKENGMYVIGVLYGYGDRMELETAGADCIVADVNELKVKLNNI